MNKRQAARQARRAERMAIVNSDSASVPVSSMTPGSEFFEWMTGGVKSAGVILNEKTAMTVSAIYACVQLIAGAVASLPIPIYQRENDDSRQSVDHPIWRLLNIEPHPIMGAATFWEFILTSKLLHGDGFARIWRKGRYNPEIVSIEPLHPLAVQPLRVGDRLCYYLMYTNEILDQDDILHFTGIGYDIPIVNPKLAKVYGYRSMSPLKYALRYAGGIALAADQFSANFFGDGSKPEFVIKTEAAKLTDEQKTTIQNAWRDMIGGNRFKPGVLSAGMSLQELTLTAEDAQLVATRQFQVEDVARIYGVPPFMIGHTANTSSWGTGVESMGIGFVKYTLQRHLVKIEQELNRKLLGDTPEYFCEFLTAGLERGDTKGRFDAYRVGLGRAGEPGFLTVNEVRRRENLPPIEGGDVLFKGTGDAPTSAPDGA